MSFWIVLWKLCLVASLAAFAVMAVFVTIGGAFDIARLLRRLREEETVDSESIDRDEAESVE